MDTLPFYYSDEIPGNSISGNLITANSIPESKTQYNKPYNNSYNKKLKELLEIPNYVLKELLDNKNYNYIINKRNLRDIDINNLTDKLNKYVNYPKLKKKYGIFVTIENNGKFSECMGTFELSDNIYKSIIKQTLLSIFNYILVTDDRIRVDEFDKLSFKINFIGEKKKIIDNTSPDNILDIINTNLELLEQSSSYRNIVTQSPNLFYKHSGPNESNKIRINKIFGDGIIIEYTKKSTTSVDKKSSTFLGSVLFDLYYMNNSIGDKYYPFPYNIFKKLKIKAGCSNEYKISKIEKYKCHEFKCNNINHSLIFVDEFIQKGAGNENNLKNKYIQIKKKYKFFRELC